MRNADIHRETGETRVAITINLDGSGKSEIKTPIAFLNHMLELFVKHSMIDLKIEAEGDIYVDYHHTVEDVGICLGKALFAALGDKASINRYGSCFIPMDETLVLCAIDLSGRPYLVYDVDFKREKVGNFDAELVKEFLQAVVSHGMFNLHIKLLWGENTHHIIEAVFKAFGRSLRAAIEMDKREDGIPSTKGKL